MRTIILALLVLVAPPLAIAQTQPTDVVKPGENLVVEGIRPIPASLAESVGRYTEYRVATPLSWHPTRREMLIATRFADTPQLHIVKMPGGARTQLTFFKDRVMGGSFQPTRGDYLVYARDAGGNEFVQLYRLDFSTGESTLLTDGKSKSQSIKSVAT